MFMVLKQRQWIETVSSPAARVENVECKTEQAGKNLKVDPD